MTLTLFSHVQPVDGIRRSQEGRKCERNLIDDHSQNGYNANVNTALLTLPSLAIFLTQEALIPLMGNTYGNTQSPLRMT